MSNKWPTGDELIRISKALGGDETEGESLLVNAEKFADIEIGGHSALSYWEQIKAGFNLSGGGTISLSVGSVFKWTARFIAISNGRGSHFSAVGFFDIVKPDGGILVGVGGASDRTWTAAGIVLNPWEALYYILPIGSGNTSLLANFRVAFYSSALEVPADWILLAVRNGDDGIVKVGTGIHLGLGESRTNNSIASGLVPLATFTLSGASEVIDVSSGYTAYPTLVLEISNWQPATNDRLLYIQFNSSGGTAYKWGFLNWVTGTAVGVLRGLTSQAQIGIGETTAGFAWGNLSEEVLHCTLVFPAWQLGKYKSMYGDYAGREAAARHMFGQSSGEWASTAAITSITISAESGNHSGKATLYGRATP